MSHTERPPTVGYISHEAGRRLEERVKEIMARRANHADREAPPGELSAPAAERRLLERTPTTAVPALPGSAGDAP
jgi:hypothetical protein